MITKKEQEMVEKMLNEFDFISIHKYAHSANGGWYGSDNPPTIYELVKTAESLLKEGCKSETTVAINSWGFRVKVVKGRKGKTKSLELMFILESAYVDDEGFVW